MEVIDCIKRGIEAGEASNDLARKVFLSYQTTVFKNNEDIEFKIKDAIKNHLKVPFLSIQVAGSAKTGVSFFNKTKFTEGESDLDISIISLELYNRFLEIVHQTTSGFTNLTVFPSYRGQPTHKQFLNNLKKGFINPFFIPECEERSEWLDFFRHLSNDHYDLFKNINGAMYSSEYFFEHKQAECIEEFEGNMKSYDTLSSKI